MNGGGAYSTRHQQNVEEGAATSPRRIGKSVDIQTLQLRFQENGLHIADEFLKEWQMKDRTWIEVSISLKSDPFTRAKAFDTLAHVLQQSSDIKWVSFRFQGIELCGSTANSLIQLLGSKLVELVLIKCTSQNEFFVQLALLLRCTNCKLQKLKIQKMLLPASFLERIGDAKQLERTPVRLSLQHLKFLSLDFCRLDNAAVRSVAQLLEGDTGCAQSLNILSLQGNCFGQQGFAKVAAAVLKYCPHLTQFQFRKNSLLTDAAILASTADLFTQLQWIDVTGCGLTLPGFQALIDKIFVSRNCKVLNASENIISSKGLELLCNALERGTQVLIEGAAHTPRSVGQQLALQNLNLSHARIGDRGVLRLGKLLQSTAMCLKKISLGNNYITARGAVPFCKCEAVKKLDRLDFQHNYISSTACAQIGTVLCQSVQVNLEDQCSCKRAEERNFTNFEIFFDDFHNVARRFREIQNNNSHHKKSKNLQILAIIEEYDKCFAEMRRCATNSIPAYQFQLQEQSNLSREDCELVRDLVLALPCLNELDFQGSTFVSQQAFSAVCEVLSENSCSITRVQLQRCGINAQLFEILKTHISQSIRLIDVDFSENNNLGMQHFDALVDTLLSDVNTQSSPFKTSQQLIYAKLCSLRYAYNALNVQSIARLSQGLRYGNGQQLMALNLNGTRELGRAADQLLEALSERGVLLEVLSLQECDLTLKATVLQKFFAKCGENLMVLNLSLNHLDDSCADSISHALRQQHCPVLEQLLLDGNYFSLQVRESLERQCEFFKITCKEFQFSVRAVSDRQLTQYNQNSHFQEKGEEISASDEQQTLQMLLRTQQETLEQIQRIITKRARNEEPVPNVENTPEHSIAGEKADSLLQSEVSNGAEEQELQVKPAQPKNVHSSALSLKTELINSARGGGGGSEQKPPTFTANPIIKTSQAHTIYAQNPITPLVHNIIPGATKNFTSQATTTTAAAAALNNQNLTHITQKQNYNQQNSYAAPHSSLPLSQQLKNIETKNISIINQFQADNNNQSERASLSVNSEAPAAHPLLSTVIKMTQPVQSQFSTKLTPPPNRNQEGGGDATVQVAMRVPSRSTTTKINRDNALTEYSPSPSLKTEQQQRNRYAGERVRVQNTSFELQKLNRKIEGLERRLTQQNSSVRLRTAIAEDGPHIADNTHSSNSYDAPIYKHSPHSHPGKSIAQQGGYQRTDFAETTQSPLQTHHVTADDSVEEQESHRLLPRETFNNVQRGHSAVRSRVLQETESPQQLKRTPQYSDILTAANLQIDANKQTAERKNSELLSGEATPSSQSSTNNLRHHLLQDEDKLRSSSMPMKKRIAFSTRKSHLFDLANRAANLLAQYVQMREEITAQRQRELWDKQQRQQLQTQIDMLRGEIDTLIRAIKALSEHLEERYVANWEDNVDAVLNQLNKLKSK